MTGNKFESRSASMQPCIGSGQKGISLIEVMVSVLILSVGLLGIAAMQATALRNGQSSFERSQTVIQSYGILDSIRADRANATSYNSGGMRCSAVPVAVGASPEQAIAQAQVNEWVASLKSSIGLTGDATTCGAVDCVANAIDGNTCTVTVQWDDTRAKGLGNTAGSSTNKAVTVAAI